jgi:putative ABC transport system permease protein
MFVNYLKVALRTTKKQKWYSLINILGLAIGMASAISIYLFISDELSYDRFHEKSKQIYRLEGEIYLTLPGPLGPFLMDKLPEVQNYARIYSTKVWGKSIVIGIDNQKFYTEGLIYADPEIFNIFTFPFLEGNSQTALSDLNSIVISEEISKNLFGRKNPIGEIISYENKYDFQVTGVIKNIPSNSHLDFDFVIPLENYRRLNSDSLHKWGNNAFHTYLQLLPDAKHRELEKAIGSAIEEEGRTQDVNKLFLRPLTEIHLSSHKINEFKVNSHSLYVYIFSGLAVLVLLIACLNFVNLSTAQSSKRMIEVGLRKVVGAHRKQLIFQFLDESLAISLIALFISIVFIGIFLPYFNNFLGKNISLGDYNILSLGLVIFSIAAVTGLLAGIFPAFFLSSFEPISAIKGTIIDKKGNKLNFRSILVVLQFTISISLIACTLIINKQTNFMRKKNLGFTKDQIIVINTHRDREALYKIELLVNQFNKNSNVLSTTVSSQTPGNFEWGNLVKKMGAHDDERIDMKRIAVDHNFMNTYDIQLSAGKFFSRYSDTESYVLNETAVKMLGWQNPQEAVGKKIFRGNRLGEIVGVVNDFHFMSLHEKIEPSIFFINPRQFYKISVRARAENISSTLKALKSIWDEVLPGRPFDFSFMDEEYSRQYQADFRMKTFMESSTLLAILISCLGLFGLAAFTADCRTKEIGIRKVLGASNANIFQLLTKNFLILILISNLISWPATFYFMSNWLQSFAYRTNMNIMTFMLAGIIALGIAFLAILFQTLKAASANPVDSLRHE